MGSQSGEKYDDNWDFLSKDEFEKLKKMYTPEFFTPRIIKYFKEFNLTERLIQRETVDGVATSPLMEVLSITLHKYQDDGTPSEIHGTIQVDDGEGPSFRIYSRTANEPQRFRNGGRLILSRPKGCRAIIPSNKVDIRITLLNSIHKNSDDDGEMEGIVEASYRWDFTKFSEYDIPLKSKIDGAHGFVMVEYVVYRHAVSVTVDAKLLKKEADDGRVNFAHVYGTISARCGNNCSTNLFEKVESEAVMVEYGSAIELSSAVVVTPVWAKFVIQAELWSHGSPEVIVTGETDNFSPIDRGSYSLMIEGKDDMIEAKVTWRPTFMHIPTGNDTHELFPVVKRMRIAPDPSLSETTNRILLSHLRKSLEQTGFPQFEVFSISVHNSNKKEFSLWGSVVAEDVKSCDRFLFKKEKTTAQRLVHNQTIPIMFPRECMKGLEFNILVDLKDDDDCVVSYGRICWSPIHPQTLLTSYGGKLCSVIVGDNGYYTALYCSIFDGGIQAVVKVHLIDKSSTLKNVNVYGKVQSQYSTFKYFTIDDNEFYTRKLFVRRIEECALEFAESKILLSESIVSVPLTCALYVDVDLKVNSGGVFIPSTDNSNDILRGTAKHVGRAVFSTADKTEHWFSDETLDHQIQVSVEWKQC